VDAEYAHRIFHVPTEGDPGRRVFVQGSVIMFHWRKHAEAIPLDKAHRQLEENILLLFQVVWRDDSSASVVLLSERMSQKCVDVISVLAASQPSCVVKQVKELFVWVRTCTLPIR
jgi:hypothetical protein